MPMAKKLRKMKRLYRQAKRFNKESELYGDVDAVTGHPKRQTIKKSRGCLMGKIKYDAEDYYC